MNKTKCIITSASNKFFPSLLNLLGSIEANYPNHPDVYVYDLGLFYTFRKELESISWVHILDVPHFVEHWRACYTWKTYILNTPLSEKNLYLDAGCQVLKPLDELFDKIENQGYLAVSQGTSIIIKDIAPQEYLDMYNLSESDTEKNVITAGIFGFKKDSIIKKVTESLYKAGLDGLCLGFSRSEIWKNKGANKTSFIRDCKMFRHDTTLLTVLLRKEIPNATIEPVELFSDQNKNNNQQLIWNFRMNYKILDFVSLSILHKNFNFYSQINRIYISVFLKLKSISNKIKRGYAKNDLVANIFKMEYMDELHDYPSMFSNIRYYHRLKARIIKKFILNNHSLEKIFLDAGAGRGPYCLIASPLFKKVYCDEYDTDELAKAQDYIQNKNMKNVEFLHNDLTHTSYPNDFIDTAVCSEVLEHIPERRKAAAELYRILKPGGKLLLSMPQKNSLFYKHVKKVHKEALSQPEPADSNENMWHFMQHVKFSHKDIEKIATDAGFIIIKRYGANVLPLGEKIFSKIYKISFLFKMYIFIEFLLEKLLPRFASFYFIELTKKHD